MRIFAIFLLLALALFAMNAPARADDPVYACGAALKAELDTRTQGVCDFYSRQLSYAKERQKFQKLLLERQKNFAEPRKAAIAEYQKNLAAYYKNMDTGSAAGNNAGNE